jgi:hypothetical protein
MGNEAGGGGVAASDDGSVTAHPVAAPNTTNAQTASTKSPFATEREQMERCMDGHQPLKLDAKGCQSTKTSLGFKGVAINELDGRRKTVESINIKKQ